MNGKRHRQQEWHRQDRAEDQQALLADEREQFAQRYLMALDGVASRGQRFGEPDFGVAELDGSHES